MICEKSRASPRPNSVWPTTEDERREASAAADDAAWASLLAVAAACAALWATLLAVEANVADFWLALYAACATSNTVSSTTGGMSESRVRLRERLRERRDGARAAEDGDGGAASMARGTIAHKQPRTAMAHKLPTHTLQAIMLSTRTASAYVERV